MKGRRSGKRGPGHCCSVDEDPATVQDGSLERISIRKSKISDGKAARTALSASAAPSRLEIPPKDDGTARSLTEPGPEMWHRRKRRRRRR